MTGSLPRARSRRRRLRPRPDLAVLPAHRPGLAIGLLGVVRSGACRAPGAQPQGAPETPPRPGVVARFARQSPEREAVAVPCGADRGGGPHRAASADRRDYGRSRDRNDLHGRHDPLAAAPRAGRPIRLADGGRQPGRLPPLARLARDCRRRSDRGRRPPARHAGRAHLARGAAAPPPPYPGTGGFRPFPAARKDGFPRRPARRPIVDATSARPAATIVLKRLPNRSYLRAHCRHLCRHDRRARNHR